MSSITNTIVINEETEEQQIALQSSKTPTESQLKIIASIFEGDSILIERHSFNPEGAREQVMLAHLSKEFALDGFVLEDYIRTKGEHLLERINQNGTSHELFIPIEDFAICFTADVNIEPDDVIKISYSDTVMRDEDDEVVDFEFSPNLLIEISRATYNYISNNLHKFK